MALQAEIPANWQRGCGLAPLFALIVEWSVCQGDTLGLASMNCLFPLLFSPGDSVAVRQVTSTFKNYLCAPTQEELLRLSIVGQEMDS